MKEAITFGSAIFSDDAVYPPGNSAIPYGTIAKLYHGNVANYVNGVPITQALTIRLDLHDGQQIILHETLDISPHNKDKRKGRLDEARSRFGAALSVASQLSGLQPRNISSVVDNFFAAAWSKHSTRLVDFFWLLVFGGISATLIYATVHTDLVDAPNALKIPALGVMLGALYMALRNFMQFMSDR